MIIPIKWYKVCLFMTFTRPIKWYKVCLFMTFTRYKFSLSKSFTMMHVILQIKIMRNICKLFAFQCHVDSCLWWQLVNSAEKSLEIGMKYYQMWTSLHIFKWKIYPKNIYTRATYRVKSSVSSTTTGRIWLSFSSTSASTASFLTEHMALDS